MRMNYVPMHSRDHADSEYLSHVGVKIDRKGTEFIGNKQSDKQTYRHSTLYVSTDADSCEQRQSKPGEAEH